MRMGEIEIHDYARQMLEAYGDKAIVTAAQRACRYEERSDRRCQNLAAHRIGVKVYARSACQLTPRRLTTRLGRLPRSLW